MENLPEVKIQTTKEVEPDFLKLIYNQKYPDGCVVQIEFEAKDEKKTDAKMLQYVAMNHLKYGLPVDLHLIYLLRGRPRNIKGEVRFGGLVFRYPVYCTDEISYREFIYSDVPEEVILAVLADPEDQKPAGIVRMILERLYQLRGNTREFYKFINQLKIMSMLRNLRKETQKQFKEMIINEDIARQIEEDEMFQMGTKQGLEQGLEKGKLKQAIVGIVNMAAKGFDLKTISEVLEVEPKFVASVLEQYKKKKEIIVLLKKRGADMDGIAKKMKVRPTLVEVIKEDLQ